MPVKVIFIKDSEPIPFELDGMAGEAMNELRSELEAAKEGDSLECLVVMGVVRQLDGKSRIVSFGSGAVSQIVNLLGEMLTTILVNNSDKPEAMCGEFSENLLHMVQKLKRGKKQQAHNGLIVPDKPKVGRI